MNRLISVLAFVLLISTSGFAQRGGQFQKDYQKIKSEKISFITDAIELTPEEAEKFWPVYNEFEKKKWEMMSERHQLERSLRENLEDLSEKEYVILAEKLASFPKVDGDLNIEYNEKFMKILTPKKVVKLYVAETQFRNTILRKYRSGKGKGAEKTKTE